MDNSIKTRKVTSLGLTFTASYDFAGCTTETLIPIVSAAMAYRYSQPLIVRMRKDGKTDEEILAELAKTVDVLAWATKANLADAKAQAKLEKSTDDLVDATKDKTDDEKRKFIEDMAKRIGLAL